MKRLIAVVALTAAGLNAGAQDALIGAPNDESVRFVRRHVTYEVNKDGTATTTAESVLSPIKRAAIDGVAQQTLSFQEGMSTVEVTEAYTQKADGKRIDVPADKIVVQVPPGFANAPMYADMKMKRVIFSDVDVGDQVVLRYKRVISTPHFPGQFADTDVFAANTRYDEARIVVKHPKSYAMQFQVRGLNEQPMQESNGMVTREWHYKNDTIVVPDPGATSNMDRDPLIETSSFKSWAAIAEAYDSRAKDKAVATAEIKKLADEITSGLKTKPEQARALYEWVSKNIRYIAFYLGAGGYVPHTANSILENKYGDCKDYSTLLSALLNAKGIANETVLIHASNRFSLPTIPTPSAFNHAIIYLNDMKVYLDATARMLPFGVLSPVEVNKQVLHTKQKKLMTTPNLKPADRLLRAESDVVIDDTGAMKGTTTLTDTGLVAAEIQGLLVRLDNPQASKQVVTALLSIEGFTGTADFTNVRPQFADTHVAYQSNFTANNAANLPGPGAMRLPTGLMSINSLRIVAMQSLNTPPAKVDRLCIPGVFEEASTIKLPDSVKPGVLPKDVNASNAAANYRASYVIDGNSIKVTRRYEITPTSTVCSPQDSAANREILEQVRRDTSAQMTY